MRAVPWLCVAGVGVWLTLAPGATALTQPSAPLDPQPFTIPVPAGDGDCAIFNPCIVDAMGNPNCASDLTLPSLFKFRGENIDFQADAKTEPSTFSPLCSFSGTLVLR